MQKVSVREVTGERQILAFVRREGGTVYVCPVDQYAAAKSGADASVVGFPVQDVRLLVGELEDAD